MEANVKWKECHIFFCRESISQLGFVETKTQIYGLIITVLIRQFYVLHHHNGWDFKAFCRPQRKELLKGLTIFSGIWTFQSE